MKKMLVLSLIILIILISIFAFYLISPFQKKEEINPDAALALQNEILNNSEWIQLNDEDFFGYVNETYTKPVNKVITSLEDAIPVIFHTSNDKFGDNENGNFVVASAFHSSGQVYVYSYDETTNSYKKILSSLENLLKDANAVFIYNPVEGV